jgi:hypothetical protein
MANTFTATQATVLFTDLDGDGAIDPGETVTTTVTIANDSTTTDAPNVSFDETLSGMTQTGSVTANVRWHEGRGFHLGPAKPSVRSRRNRLSGLRNL